jgi:peptide/nickel transport system permease protein
VRRRYRLLASLGAFVLITFAAFALLRGGLGWSPTNAEPVAQAIVERLPATVELAFFAFAAAIALGAIIGFIRARARAPLLRGALAVLQLAARSVPVLVLALFLQLLFLFTGVLPPGGISASDSFDAGDRLRHLIVPVLCLAVPFGAWVSLIFYDFFRATGDALRTPARGILGPLARAAASIGPALLASCLFIEPMFAWPGVARLLAEGLRRFDPGIVAACVLLYCAAIVAIDVVAQWALPDQLNFARTFARRRQGTNVMFVVAIAVLLIAVFSALAASLIAPAGAYFIDQLHWQGYPLPPGVAGHALGTDENGRDLLARVLVALRTSLGIAVLAALIAAAIGFLVAKATTPLHPVQDRAALSTIGIRAFAGFPFVLAAVTILVVRSGSVHVLSPPVIALLIGLVCWPTIVPAFRRLTTATLGGLVDLVACALMLEMTQSFIGFGVQPPTPSLGNMFANAQSNITVAPWVPIVSSVVVVVVLFALYALGDALRERDPV